MAFIVMCSCCGTELNEPGAIYLSAPNPDDLEEVSKLHLCPDCDKAVNDLLYSRWEALHPEQAEVSLIPTEQTPP